MLTQLTDSKHLQQQNDPLVFTITDTRENLLPVVGEPVAKDATNEINNHEKEKEQKNQPPEIKRLHHLSNNESGQVYFDRQPHQEEKEEEEEEQRKFIFFYLIFTFYLIATQPTGLVFCFNFTSSL